MIYVLSGGGSGGTGATLVVSAPAGVTATATKEDKSYARVVNSDGIATFRGLSSGTWALSICDASHDPTTPVDVIITADYDVTLAFFSATINITYPEGSACKATHTDGTELTAPDTSGTWTCVVPSAGTWTILSTANDGSGKSKSVEVEITSEGQSVNVELTYQLVLFENGTINDTITGGFDASYSISGNNLVVSYGVAAGTAGSKNMTTKNSIDISGYDCIYLDVVSTSNTGSFAHLQSISFQIIRDSAVLGQVKLNGYNNQTASLPLDEYKSGGDVKFRFYMNCNEGSVGAVISRFYLE